MAESDPDLVARLVALNERTRKAWAHPHNKSYYIPPSFQGFQERERASRHPTPCDINSESDGAGHDEDTEPELRIYLNNPPRNLIKGWLFGSDRKVCDIYCGEPDEGGSYNIGRQTFSITINKRREVMLKHHRNTNQTHVQYDAQKAGQRYEFVWIMLPYCRSIVVTCARQLKFQIIAANPSGQAELYKRLRSYFLKDVELSMPGMPLYSAKNGATMPEINSEPIPKTKPFYYVRKDRVLGSGSFGMVYIVVDVSTGVEYAGKTFFGEINMSEADILAMQNHVNILRYITLSQDDGPLLVTEYIKWGNLARPWEVGDRDPWQIDQIVSILTQALRGLASLHAHPNPVIHRDIKPENILVASHEQSEPWIKLADFGLATQGTTCIGQAGTWMYTAPEVFFPQPYTSKIDIWSLGVVILQLLLGGNIPEPSTGTMQGPQWCKDICGLAKHNARFYNGLDQIHLRDNEWSLRTFMWTFIFGYMLQPKSTKRLSAQECLNHPLLLEMRRGSKLTAGWREEPRFSRKGEWVSSTVNITKQFPQEGKASLSRLIGGAVTKPKPSSSGNQASSSAIASVRNTKTSPAAYDPGVEVAVALQESRASKTAKPPQTARPKDPQPVGFKLIIEDHDGSALGG